MRGLWPSVPSLQSELVPSSNRENSTTLPRPRLPPFASWKISYELTGLAALVVYAAPSWVAVYLQQCTGSVEEMALSSSVGRLGI